MFVFGHCLFIGAFVCSLFVDTLKHSGYRMYMFCMFLAVDSDYLLEQR
jgi:hypothetical protein